MFDSFWQGILGRSSPALLHSLSWAWLQFLLLACKGLQTVVKWALFSGSEDLGTVLELMGMYPRVSCFPFGLPCFIWKIKELDWYSDFSTEGGDMVHYTSSCLEILSCSFWGHAPSQCVCLGSVRNVADGRLLHETIVKAEKGWETLAKSPFKVPSNFMMLWPQSSRHLTSQGLIWEMDIKLSTWLAC